MSSDATRCARCGGEFSRKRIIVEGNAYHESCAIMSYPSRTNKDYAIEFGGYLATSAEAFLNFLDQSGASVRDEDRDGMSDHWRDLRSAIYEFRKRAAVSSGERA